MKPITIKPLPATPFAKRGIYGTGRSDLPERFRWLHPDAASSIMRLEKNYPGVFRFSDVLRSPAGSKRVRTKYKKRHGRFGGKLPGYSAHGFGLATDHDVDGNLKRLAKQLGAPRVEKRAYDELLRDYGWVCHRDGPQGDHRPGSEDWHFNFFADDMARWGGRRYNTSKTSGGVEAKVQALYGPFTLNKREVQRALAAQGLYRGAIDGRHGAKTRTAVAGFQRQWTLKSDGDAGAKTQRVLCFVNARFVTSRGHSVSPW